MKIWSSRHLFSRFILVILALFFYSGLMAQSLPSEDRCTSKDLLLVGASIADPGVDCECESGLRTLRLTIDNKTGSTRTSFAAWGTLIVNGDPASATPIFACGGPIAPKSITEIVTGTQINYTCGTSLEIRGLFLAWTSASPNETCAVLEANPGGISPKCGTLSSITVDVGDTPGAPTKVGDLTECQKSPIQTLSASNRVTVPSGITVTWYNAATGGSTVSSPTLNTVGTVTYHAEASNGTCVSPRTPVTLTINASPAAPGSTGNITECAENPIQALNANDALTSTTGVTWYNAASGGSTVGSPALNSVGTATYYAEYSNGTCTSLARTPVTLTINASTAPPTSTGDITECAEDPIQNLHANDALTSTTGVAWYNAASGGSTVGSPTLNSIGMATYYAEYSDGTCKSLTRTPVTLKINETPAAAAICIDEPSLCGPATGSITVLSPTGAYEYSIDGGANYQSGAQFSGLSAGSNPVVVVKNTSTTCVSDPSNCSNYTNCSDPAKAIVEPLEQPAVSPISVESPEKLLENPELPVENPELPEIKPEILEVPVSEISVKAFPNPFNNEIRFNVNIPEASKGRLELVNMLGQKVKTVFDGQMNEGMNAFEVNIPSGEGTSTLFYILYVGDQQFTGKLLRTNRND